MRVEYDDVETDDDLKVTYQGEHFTGEVVERSPQGQVIASTTYFSGMADGPYAEWYPTGERRAAGNLRYGLLVGVHEEWHSNGVLATRNEYNQGMLLSRSRWSQDGTPLEVYVADT